MILQDKAEVCGSKLHNIYQPILSMNMSWALLESPASIKESTASLHWCLYSESWALEEGLAISSLYYVVTNGY